MVKRRESKISGEGASSITEKEKGQIFGVHQGLMVCFILGYR
jgi:hypothetical protein